MPPPKHLVVIGVTGQQGGSVARLFARDPSWRVRGVTRNTSSTSATALHSLGIELIAADLDDPASLSTAFEGAHAIFAVTDFWQFVSNPQIHSEAATRGIHPNELALEREVQQGKNVVGAAAKHLGTLERFVWSTLSNTKKWSGGEIVWNLHFDGKALITEYLQTTHPDLAAKATYLQMGYYLSNYQSRSRFAPHKQPDGSYAWYQTAGLGPHPKLLPFVNPPHDTGYFVRALIAAPAGSTMLGFSRMLTLSQWAELWGRVKGVESKLVEVEGAELKARLDPQPEWLNWEIDATERYVTVYGWTGGDPKVQGPEELGVNMGELTDLEEWVRKEATGVMG